MPARTESRFIEISDNIIFGGSRGEGNGAGDEGVVEEEPARADERAAGGRQARWQSRQGA